MTTSPFTQRKIIFRIIIVLSSKVIDDQILRGRESIEGVSLVREHLMLRQAQQSVF